MVEDNSQDLDIQHVLDSIEDYWRDLEELRNPPDELDNIKCRELVRGYVQFWGDPREQFEVEAVELDFELPILDPATGEDTGEKYRGFFDKVVVNKADGIRYVIDHKTSGEAIEDPTSGFWRRWGVNSQASLYLLAMRQMDTTVGGLLVDAVKKPGIRPTKKDGGLEGYSMRLREHIAANPERYYARQTAVRSGEELIEALEDMHSVTLDVIDKRESGCSRFHKNTTSCFAYGSACKFLGICSSLSDFDDPRWERKEASEPVWSNSRLNTYLGCPRKYFYEYEIFGHGVTKLETNHNLVFGSLFHSYLDHIYGKAIDGPEESD